MNQYSVNITMNSKYDERPFSETFYISSENEIGCGTFFENFPEYCKTLLETIKCGEVKIRYVTVKQLNFLQI